MAKLTDEELRAKILELDAQMSELADILSIMVDKMDRIESATTQMKNEIQTDMGEIMDDSKHRKI